MSEQLERIQQKLKEQHDKTYSVFERAEIDTETRLEYKRQIEQYDGMYQSLHQMKALSKDEKTIAALEEKQIELLTQRIAFEQYCLKTWGK